MYVPQYVTPVKKKRGGNFTVYKEVKRTWNVNHRSVTIILYHKTHVLDQIPLSTNNVVDYIVITIHESNTPFTDKRHQFIMMCAKDILQPFFKDLK